MKDESKKLKLGGPWTTPGWIVRDGYSTGEDGMHWAHFRVRKWHPGYWLACVRALCSVILGRKRPANRANSANEV